MFLKSVTYKNFQSVGNHPMTINLDNSPSTLVSGMNGSGKSTLAEAIVYGLFGKTMKKIKLSGIINSTNKKNLVVEVEFDKNGHSYKVIRGEKPKKFDIYKDNELIDQSANARDYQNILDKITGFTYNTFIQTIVLNKEKYVPFMEQSVAERRKIVESVLDIDIFSYMSDVAKDTFNELKIEKDNLEHQRDVTKTKIEGQTQLLQQSKNNTEEQIKSINEEIEEVNNELEFINNNYTQMLDKFDEDEFKSKKTSKTKQKKKVDEYNSLAVKFETNIDTLNKNLKFYEDNDTCPTCRQTIDEDLVKDISEDTIKEIDSIKSTVKEMMKEYVKEKDQLKEYENEIQEYENLVSELSHMKKQIDLYESNKNKLIKKIEVLENNDDKTKEYKEKLDYLQKEFDDLTKNMNTISDRFDMYFEIRKMLKDDGIKSIIVSEYIDFINNKINQFLNSMNFYVNITLDENFNEKINSINRDGFTYDNLSTGQKTRVSLAIWLALHEISMIKNSNVCNVLFLDELLENLDSNGVEDFMHLVSEKMQNKNVFVITQRADEFKEYFRNELKFEQDEYGYTKII